MIGAVPGAPTIQKPIVPGDGQITLAFDPPAETGGRPITGYLVRVEPDEREIFTNASPCVIRGLANGQPYTFTVAAENDIGRGAWSDESRPVIPGQFLQYGNHSGGMMHSTHSIPLFATVWSIQTRSQALQSYWM